MPRGGNDPAKGQFTDERGIADFGTEIRTSFGDFVNAEDLIRAHQANQDPALARAGLTQIDLDATDALDTKKASGKFDLGDGETLEAYAVRGNALVGVISDANGNLYKAVVGANADYKAPTLTPEQEASKAADDHARAIASEAARLRQEMNQALAEQRADLEAKMAEQIEKVKADADAALAKAQAGDDSKGKDKE